jgi:bacterioferritin
MLHASADQRVLGYLGRALSLEFSAVQLYSTQARLVATWELAEPAERLRNESREEMEHADRIIARMLSLGVAPSASQLRPVRLGNSLRELLLHDLAFENELITLYSDATRHCALIGDHDGRLFFEALLEEERNHSRELSQWIEGLQQPGKPGPRTTPRGATF